MPISPDTAALVLESLRAGVDLPRALRGARVTATAWADALAADPALDTAAQAALAEARADADRAQREAWAALAAESAAREAAERAEERSRVKQKEHPRGRTRTKANASSDPEAPRSVDGIAAAALAIDPGPLGWFLAIDAACVTAGFSPTSEWWRESIARFYASGKRWGIWQVGRGGAKSTTLERLAASDALGSTRVIPPGQRWEYPFVSVGPEDANRRIRGIEAIYKRALGLDVSAALSPRPHIDMQDASENDIKLASVAGTIGNLSGLNAIGLIVDEAAKLHDKTENANPLSELIASVIGAFRSRPGIRAILCSSSWARSGAFWQLVEQGDTETNYVARLGARFLPAALAGLEAVAQWEEIGDAARMRPPDPLAAYEIRAHAKSLTAESPAIPTWIANEMFGPDPATAAVATRREVQALPASVLGNLPRHRVWLREIASVPMDVDADGTDYSEQCRIAAAITEYLNAGIVKLIPRYVAQRQVAAHPLAGPGDARYAGPERGPNMQRERWFQRTVM